MKRFLKIAEESDINDILRLAREFHRASPYSTMKFDPEVGREFLRRIILGDKTEGIVILARHSGKTVGFVVGIASTPVFTSNKVSMELGWWVSPKYRKTRSSYLLYKAYEDWAVRAGCDYVQGAFLPGVSPDLDAFYKKRGYREVESSYLKTLRVGSLEI